MPDHVHIFIKAPPTLAIDKLVQGQKGYTYNVLRHERPWLQKIKTLWSPSYYVESIGHISEETVRRYIEEQKKRHNGRQGRFHPTAKASGLSRSNIVKTTMCW